MLARLAFDLVNRKILKRISSRSVLENKVVLITGGSKGLGFVLAKHLIRERSRIAICARDLEELQQAQRELKGLGASDLHIQVCDVAQRESVQKMIGEVIAHFGHLDVVINNAGIILVGPVETMAYQDFQRAMDVMYWGPVHTTLAVLPHLKARGMGQIVNVTSIAGKVSVPHLLPYNAAKSAAEGFSQGIAAELKKDGITVTTIVPWLMRTGSYVNAWFQEGNRREFKLFSFLSTAPFITVSADSAARQIIEAIKQKKHYKVVGFQARLAIAIKTSFPNLTVRVFGMLTGFLPGQLKRLPLVRGRSISNSFRNAEVPWVRALGKRLQDKHQHSPL